MIPNVTDTIIYEQPLNERIRTFLRIEFLFNRVDLILQHDNTAQHRDALTSLLNILSLLERSDLKQEIIKELERLTTALSALENIPGVDMQALNELLGELDQILDALHLKKSTIGQELRDNEFLSSIRQRSTIAGGTCDFDLPAYHYWLEHSSNEAQKQQLLLWIEQLSSVRSAIDIALKLIRNSTGFRDLSAVSGFYQQSLDNNHSHQLIRVKIPKEAVCYPEISGGKHRFTVRFMHFDIEQRAKQISNDIEFSLSCCAM
jgi:cell division protein ZapD